MVVWYCVRLLGFGRKSQTDGCDLNFLEWESEFLQNFGIP